MTGEIEVISGGAETTVQDTGRPGFLSKGIPPCGAQDNRSLRLANRLVGNPDGVGYLSLGDPGAAGLEMLLMGPTLHFLADATIAITGATFEPTLDDTPVPMYETVRVGAGSILKVGTAKHGARGYLAIRGGIAVRADLGSRSTYVRGHMGGFAGRRLSSRDRLPFADPGDANHLHRRVPSRYRPTFAKHYELRVIRGPQVHLYEPASVEEFFSATWTLTPVTDRMGSRFSGPKLRFLRRPAYLSRDAGSGEADIVDDVTPLGGIQTPGGEELIVMGVEIPSVGGYAKLGAVIAADLGTVAQMRPGQTASFREVDVQTAVDLERAENCAIREAPKACKAPLESAGFTARPSSEPGIKNL